MRLNDSRPHLASVAALLLAALTILPSQAAPQWKWRDAAGQIQYSDRPPPPGVAEKDILARPSAAARAARTTPVASDTASQGAAATAKPPALKASDPELEARKRKADAEADAARKAEEEKVARARADNCVRARDYQRSLNDGLRIARTNSKGEREILDDKARAQEQARAQEIINNDCK